MACTDNYKYDLKKYTHSRCSGYPSKTNTIEQNKPDECDLGTPVSKSPTFNFMADLYIFFINK